MAAHVRMEECAHCGHQFRAGRPACPECGSDADTGWKSAEEIDYQSVALPDDLAESSPQRGRRHRWWLALVAALIAAFAFAVLGCKGRESSHGARTRSATILQDGRCRCHDRAALEAPGNKAGGAPSGRRAAPTATKPLVAAPAAMG